MTTGNLGQIALALVLSGCAGLAMAQQKDPLAGMDENGDGSVSRQEALAAQKSAFERIDKNDDGVVSKSEYADMDSQGARDGRKKAPDPRRTQARAAWFKNLDNDDSGDIKLAEFQKAMTPYFDKLDSNGDGAIDSEEFEAASKPPSSKTKR